MKAARMALAGLLGTALLVGGPTASAAPEADASHMIDSQNVEYVFMAGGNVPVEILPDFEETSGAEIEPYTTGFGSSSAARYYSETSNEYTVKHKGWKRRKSQSSSRGMRACCTTVCTPSKRFWTKASMTTALGKESTTSGQLEQALRTRPLPTMKPCIVRMPACVRHGVVWGRSPGNGTEDRMHVAQGEAKG